MPSLVTAIPPASPEAVATHYTLKLALETDCADVHDALSRGVADFVLLEARGPAAYARGHVPGALNLPHREISAGRLAAWPKDTLFVVYCAGPHRGLAGGGLSPARRAGARRLRRVERIGVGPEGPLAHLCPGILCPGILALPGAEVPAGLRDPP
jgi:rhodanese-related sulfurtransferase